MNEEGGIITTFDTSRKLYGRNEELSTLRDTYERVCLRGGRPEAITISGSSGSGKTALAHLMRSQFRKSHNVFAIWGEFDQIQFHRPYSAIASAFTELVSLILQMDDEIGRAEIVDELKTSVKSEGKPLTNILPTISSIIGACDEAAAVGGIEALNRLTHLFRLFVRAVSRPSHPLVLFLDDMQWADVSSLELVGALLNDTEAVSFLVIATRQKTDGSRPFAKTSASEHIRLTDIDVGNLSFSSTNEFVADSLHLPTTQTELLTKSIYRITNGNILFAQILIFSINNRNAVVWRQDLKQWEWEPNCGKFIKEVTSLKDLLSHQIELEPPEVQEILMCASCFGCSFESTLISKILCDEHRPNLFNNLKDAEAANEAISHCFNVAVTKGFIQADHSNPCWFRFRHGSIRDAMYNRMSDFEIVQRHRHIGSLILKNTPKLLTNEDFGQLLLAVDQLNRGEEISGNTQKNIPLAAFNLRAGESASERSCFEAASSFFKAGIEKVGENGWEEHYDLTFKLYKAAAETEYYIGKFGESDLILRKVLANAKYPTDRMRASSFLVDVCGAQNRIKEAVDTGFRYLEQLGETFPQWFVAPSALIDLKMTVGRIKAMGRENLYSLPVLSDEVKKAAIAMLASMAFYTFVGRPHYTVLIVNRIVNISIHHGVCGESAIGFCMLGQIMCATLGELETGRFFGDFSLELVRRLDAKTVQARVFVHYYFMIKSWGDQIQSCVDGLRYGYRVAHLAGDMEYAFVGMVICLSFSFYGGRPLVELERDYRKYCTEMKLNQGGAQLALATPCWQTVLNLIQNEACDDPVYLSGTVMDCERELHRAQKEQNTVVPLIIYGQQMILAFLFDDLELAWDTVVKHRSFRKKARYAMSFLFQVFFDALITIALVRESESTCITCDKAGKLFAFHRIWGRVKLLAKKSPPNFLNKQALLEAEYFALRKKTNKAIASYESSIELGQRYGFVHEVAIACERAGRYCVDIGDLSLAESYFIRAHKAYTSWGASRKTNHLEKQYSSYVTSWTAVPRNREGEEFFAYQTF